MKKLYLLLLCCSLLLACTACGPKAEAPIVQVETDTFYPFQKSGDTVHWSADGTQLLAQNGNTLQFIGLNNQLNKTVTIAPEFYPAGAQMVFSDTRILLTNQAYLYEYENQFQLVNATIWDMDGKCLKQFPQATVSFTANGLQHNMPLPENAQPSYIKDITPGQFCWLDDSRLAICAQDCLLIYNIEKDTFSLVDDLRDWMQDLEKDSYPYYGIVEDSLTPYNGKLYYFAYKEPGKANSSGNVWQADEQGSQVLFDGQTFNNFTMRDQYIALANITEPKNPEDLFGYHVYYADLKDGKLQDLGDLPVAYGFPVDGHLLGMQSEIVEYSRPFILYCYDMQKKEMTSWAPNAEEKNKLFDPTIEGQQQLYLRGNRLKNGSLQMLLHTTIPVGGGEMAEKSLIYDTKTQELTELSQADAITRYNFFPLHSLGTHYYQITEEGIRVRNIDDF